MDCIIRYLSTIVAFADGVLPWPRTGKSRYPNFFARRTEAPSDAVWTVLAAVVCAGAAAAQPASPPNLSPDNVTGWVPLNYGDSFVSPADGPGPVVDDPRYQTSARTGKRSTFHVADLNNPILQPWAKEELRKRNEWILSGKPGYSVQVSCIPFGGAGIRPPPRSAPLLHTDRRHGHHDQPGAS